MNDFLEGLAYVFTFLLVASTICFIFFGFRSCHIEDVAINAGLEQKVEEGKVIWVKPKEHIDTSKP